MTISLRATLDRWIGRWEETRRQLPSINPVFKGHPLHALLTDIPASLISTGFVFSVWERMTHEPRLEAAGYANQRSALSAPSRQRSPAWPITFRWK